MWCWPPYAWENWDPAWAKAETKRPTIGPGSKDVTSWHPSYHGIFLEGKGRGRWSLFTSKRSVDGNRAEFGKQIRLHKRHLSSSAKEPITHNGWVRLKLGWNLLFFQSDQKWAAEFYGLLIASVMIWSFQTALQAMCGDLGDVDPSAVPLTHSWQTREWTRFNPAAPAELHVHHCCKVSWWR